MSSRERRARARQTGVSARPSPQRKPAGAAASAAAPRSAAPGWGAQQVLGRPPQGQAMQSSRQVMAPNSRLREGWDRPRIHLEPPLEGHEALGRQEVFGEKEQAMEQAMEFAKRRRADERAAAEAAAARSAHALTRAAIVNERGWAGLDMAVQQVAGDHKIPLLSQPGHGAGY